MTTDTPQNSRDHASKDVESATTAKAPLKKTESERAVADGKSADSTPEGLSTVLADELNNADE